MAITSAGRLAAWASLAACLFLAGGAGAQEAVAPALSVDQLARMSYPELESLYRDAGPGAVPRGYTPGKAIYCPCDRNAALRSRMTDALWHGKVFACDGGSLVNQWAGFRAIRAGVFFGPSLLDGKTSIIMDYSQTSRVWADVRDEVREVAPGLYLGRMVRIKQGCPEFQMYFALEACCSH